MNPQKPDPKRQVRDPKIDILEREPRRIIFALSETDISVANALRRVMMSEVATLAIDEVELLVNNSVLHDEFITHRLGLVPLFSEHADSFFMRTECEGLDCKGRCDKCSVEFTLDVTCDSESRLEVTTNDLLNRSQLNTIAQTVQPIHNDGGEGASSAIVIAKLARGQSIKLKAYARKGVAKLHAKYSPVSCCVFQADPEVRLNRARLDEMSAEDKAAFVECCPRKVFGIDARRDRVEVVEEAACIFCDECVIAAEKMHVKDLVSVSTKPNRFIFNVETTGCMASDTVVAKAIEVIKNKFSVLEKAVLAIDV